MSDRGDDYFGVTIETGPTAAMALIGRIAR